MKKRSTKLVAAILAAVMLFLMIPFNSIVVFAAEISSIEKLEDAELLGRGYNLLSDRSISEDGGIIGDKMIFNNSIFANVYAEKYDSVSSSYSYTYVKDAQSYLESQSHSFDMSMGVSAQILMVSVDASVKYGISAASSFEEASQLEYAILKAQKKLATYSLKLNNNVTTLRSVWNNDVTDGFKYDVNDIDVKLSPQEFFDIYGTHILTGYTEGGEGVVTYRGEDLSFAFSESEKTDTEVSAGVGIAGVVNINTTIGEKNESSTGGEEDNTNIEAYAYACGAGTILNNSFGEDGFSLDTVNNFIDSITHETSAVMVDSSLKLLPIWEIMLASNDDAVVEKGMLLLEYFNTEVEKKCKEYDPNYVNPDSEAEWTNFSNVQIISTPEQLNAVREDLDGVYVLSCNIDLSEYENWIPIGTEDAPFMGKFYGNYNSVKGLNINEYTGIYAGLFGYNAGNINNLLVDGEISLTASSDKFIGGIAAYNTGIITNCYDNVTYNVEYEAVSDLNIPLRKIDLSETEPTTITIGNEIGIHLSGEAGTVYSGYNIVVEDSGIKTPAYIMLEDVNMVGTSVNGTIYSDNGRPIYIISTGASNTISGTIETNAINATNADVYFFGDADITINGGDGKDGASGVVLVNPNGENGSSGNSAIVAQDIYVNVDNIIWFCGGDGGNGGYGTVGGTGATQTSYITTDYYDKYAGIFGAIHYSRIWHYLPSDPGGRGGNGGSGGNGGTPIICNNFITNSFYENQIKFKYGDGGNGGHAGDGGTGGKGADLHFEQIGVEFLDCWGPGAGGAGGDGGNGGDAGVSVTTSYSFDDNKQIEIIAGMDGNPGNAGAGGIGGLGGQGGTAQHGGNKDIFENAYNGKQGTAGISGVVRALTVEVSPTYISDKVQEKDNYIFNGIITAYSISSITDINQSSWDDNHIAIENLTKVDYFDGDKFDRSTVSILMDGKPIADYSVGLNSYCPNNISEKYTYAIISIDGYFRYIPIHLSKVAPVSIEFVEVDKTSFVKNTAFDIGGLIVKLNYNNGDAEYLNENSLGVYYTTPSITNVDGIETVYVYYDHDADEKTAPLSTSYDVFVIREAVLGIEIEVEPRLLYEQGDSLVTAGIKVLRIKNSGTEYVSEEHLTYSVSPSLCNVGVATVTVKDTLSGYKATYTVTVSELPGFEHPWSAEGVVTKQPTHTEEGIMTYSCAMDNCEATKTESIAKLEGHSYGKWYKLNDEYHQRICECGDTVEREHNWNGGVITTAATHLTDGEMLYTCTDCGAEKTALIEKTSDCTYGKWERNDESSHIRNCECGKAEYEAHAWDNGTVAKESTYTESGLKIYTCTVCKETYEEEIAPIGIASAPKIVVDSKYASVGKTVKVNISLKNNPGLASLKLNVEYDSNLLTLIDVSYNEGMGGMFQAPQTMNSPVTLNWFNGSANTYGDVTYAELTFQVSPDAEIGTTSDIIITYNADDVYDITETNINFYTLNGTVVFIDYMPGDINGDCTVNNKDLTRLFQHLSNWDVEVNNSALDVNGDGEVNNKDLTRLFQYLSNWEVEIY